MDSVISGSGDACIVCNVILYFLVLLSEPCGSSSAGDVQPCFAWRRAPSCGERTEHHAQLAEGINQDHFSLYPDFQYDHDDFNSIFTEKFTGHP